MIYQQWISSVSEVLVFLSFFITVMLLYTWWQQFIKMTKKKQTGMALYDSWL